MTVEIKANKVIELSEIKIDKRYGKRRAMYKALSIIANCTLWIVMLLCAYKVSVWLGGALSIVLATLIVTALWIERQDRKVREYELHDQGR